MFKSSAYKVVSGKNLCACQCSRNVRDVRIADVKASAHSFQLPCIRNWQRCHFLPNDHSLYAPTCIYLGWTSCLISFVWGQSTCQERVESDKIQNEKVLPTVGQPWYLKSDALPTGLARLVDSCLLKWPYYIYTCTSNANECLRWYKFENYEGERILSFKCTVLRYISEYISIVYK